MTKQGLNKVTQIMPGCTVFEVSDIFSCMVGVPSEVLKVFSKKDLKPPSVIISPDIFFEFGIVQAAMEFILYDFAFMQASFFKGQKLTFIGTKEQVKRIRKILRLTLLGPTKEQMDIWGIPLDRQLQVLKLANYFALKKLGTSDIAEIDDMIDFVEFNNGIANLSECTIIKKGINVFSFKLNDSDEEYLIDINLTEAQKPPLAISYPEELAPLSVLGATALSKCTTGFDHSGYTSSVILWLNGIGVSVDGVSWMKEHLRVMGISSKEIRAHIITHIHDDHSNIFDLIINGKTFYLISDYLNYRMLILKASLLLNMLEEDVMKMICLIEFEFYKPLYWYGAKFVFWPVAHSIPTFGFRVEIEGKAIIYSGDTVWGSKLKKLFDDGVIDRQMFEYIQSAPLKHSDLTFHDAGGGMIHPDIKELATLPEQARRHIVPTHLPSLPLEVQDQFTLVKPGQSWELIKPKKWQASHMLRIMNAPILQYLSSEWMNVVMAQGEIKQYPAGFEIMQQGAIGNYFYVIVGGSVQVLCDGDEVAQLSTGDFFGEMSIMYNQPVSATIKAKSPIRVLVLPDKIFLEMISSTGLAKRLERLHKIRPVLMQFGFLKYAPSSVMQKICEVASQQTFKAGEVVITQGEPGDRFYGILNGQAKVFIRQDGNNQIEVATLYKDQVFGEIALLKNKLRNATVIADTDIEVFYLKKDDFHRIVSDTPMLFHHFGILANMRSR